MNEFLDRVRMGPFQPYGPAPFTLYYPPSDDDSDLPSDPIRDFSDEDDSTPSSPLEVVLSSEISTCDSELSLSFERPRLDILCPSCFGVFSCEPAERFRVPGVDLFTDAADYVCCKCYCDWVVQREQKRAMVIGEDDSIDGGVPMFPGRCTVHDGPEVVSAKK